MRKLYQRQQISSGRARSGRVRCCWHRAGAGPIVQSGDRNRQLCAVQLWTNSTDQAAGCSSERAQRFRPGSACFVRFRVVRLVNHRPWKHRPLRCRRETGRASARPVSPFRQPSPCASVARCRTSLSRRNSRILDQCTARGNFNWCHADDGPVTFLRIGRDHATRPLRRARAVRRADRVIERQRCRAAGASTHLSRSRDAARVTNRILGRKDDQWRGKKL